MSYVSISSDHLAEAADRKANGASWEAIAEKLDLDPDDLRRLPRMHRNEWRTEYGFARKLVALDAQAEAVLTLRKHMRSMDDKVSLGAATTLVRQTMTALRHHRRLAGSPSRAAQAKRSLLAE